MSSNEQRRAALVRKLRELLGDDETATLMESLHPEPWSELATKTDIGVLRSDIEALRVDVNDIRVDVRDLRTDVDVLRTDMGVMRSDIDGLRGDLDAFKASTEREFAHVHETMDLRFTAQSAQLEALLRERLDAQTKLLFFGMIGTLVSLAGVMIGTAAL